MLKHKGDQKRESVELERIIRVFLNYEIDHFDVVVIVVRFLTNVVFSDLNELLLCDSIILVICFKIKLQLSEGSLLNCLLLFSNFSSCAWLRR